MGIPKALPREKSGLWLTKDNKLVSMHANMTATTYKLTNYFLWRAQQENKLEGLSVDCRTIIKDCNIKATNFSEVLLSECKKVALTQISVMDDNGNWKVRQVIPNMTYEDGILTADINPKVAPYIYGLKQNFTKGNMLQTNKCDTYAAIRLYETCNSWARTGYAYYSIEEWRSLLGGDKEIYERFSNFNQKIIKPAVKIVNENTDLDITPEYIKTGRKTTHMKIHVTKKSYLPEGKSSEAEQNDIVVESDITSSPVVEQAVTFTLEERDVIKKMAKEYRQTKKNAESYIRNYGVEYCKAQIEYVRQENLKQEKKRIGGYFRKAIEGDYAGSKQVQIEAAKAEKAEHEEIVAWNKDAAKMDSLFETASQSSEKALEQSILAEHPEVTALYQGMGISDDRIARWVEKYSEVLLFKIAFKLQGQSGITADYIEANLNVSEK